MGHGLFYVRPRVPPPEKKFSFIMLLLDQHICLSRITFFSIGLDVEAREANGCFVKCQTLKNRRILCCKDPNFEGLSWLYIK